MICTVWLSVVLVNVIIFIIHFTWKESITKYNILWSLVKVQWGRLSFCMLTSVVLFYSHHFLAVISWGNMVSPSLLQCVLSVVLHLCYISICHMLACCCCCSNNSISKHIRVVRDRLLNDMSGMMFLLLCSCECSSNQSALVVLSGNVETCVQILSNVFSGAWI